MMKKINPERLRRIYILSVEALSRNWPPPWTEARGPPFFGLNLTFRFHHRAK